MKLVNIKMSFSIKNFEKIIEDEIPSSFFKKEIIDHFSKIIEISFICLIALKHAYLLL